MRRILIMLCSILFACICYGEVNDEIIVEQPIINYPERLLSMPQANAGRDFISDVNQIGSSSYDTYPFSTNNWSMAYDNARNIVYIAFTDCDDLGHGWQPGMFDRTIAYQIIDETGEPISDDEQILEPTYAGYPDLILSATGRPYSAFHKSSYSWIKADIENLGIMPVNWHDRSNASLGNNYIWPQIRITQPENGSEGLLYTLASCGSTNNSTMICTAQPVTNGNGWLVDPFFTYQNEQTVISEGSSILQPTMAVSADGSVAGIVYRRGSAFQAKEFYVWSEDQGVSWNGPVELSYDNSQLDYDLDGLPDGNMVIFRTGRQLYYNSLNEPCMSYIKVLGEITGAFYHKSARVYHGKIDTQSQTLHEIRVSDVLETADAIAGCSGPNNLSIGTKIATARGGQYIFITWTDGRSAFANQCNSAEIYMSYSTDWGENWSNDINISNTQSGSSDLDEVWVTMSPQVEIDSEDNSAILHMAFMWDNSPGNSVTSTTNPGQIVMNDLMYLKYDTGVVINTTDINSSAKIKKMKTIQLSNSPNPFNPVTSISFELVEGGNIAIDIYNIKGRLVKSLINNKAYIKGNHSVTWNGKDNNGNELSSGVYLCRLAVDNNAYTCKMMLLK